MAEFEAFDSKVEVSGEGVLALVAAFNWNQAAALEILGRHGIVNPQVGEWYLLQAFLDAQKEIATSIGGHTLYQIGNKVPELAIFPPELDSLEKGLASIDIAYHMNNRGGEIGHYQLVKMESNHAVMLCHNPFPCDFDRGLIIGTAKHFAAKGATVSIKHDESKGCRKLGDESCTYIIEWLEFKKRATTHA
jgi:hypothetical protein